MESKKQKNNRIDQLFYDKLNDFSIEQSGPNWHLIQLLQKQKKKKRVFTRFSWISFGIITLISGIFYYFSYLSDSDISNKGNLKNEEGFFYKTPYENSSNDIITETNKNTSEKDFNKKRLIKTSLRHSTKDLGYQPTSTTSNEMSAKITSNTTVADVFYHNNDDVKTEDVENNYLVSTSSLIYIKYGQDSVKALMQNLGKEINSSFADYAPVINADGSILYFTSRRPVTEKEKKKNIESKEYIYFSTFNANRKTWSEAQIMPEPINIPGRFNSIIALSNDGQRMLLYRDDGFGNGDIYESVLKGKQWSEPEKLPYPINTKYHESSASISPDGRTIYFVSNRPGGVGGLDIWYATKDEKGNWSEAKNLGSYVNTKENEEGVFIHPDGRTLYFSSKGHKGLGGYDIFYTVYKDGVWSVPVNLGKDINTKGDDVYFVLEANGKVGYYSSIRTDGIGEKDIYKIEFIFPEKKEEKRPLLTLFKGLVLDKETQQPLEAKIEIIDIEKNQQISLLNSNSATGQFLLSLPSGKNYGINVKKEGYLFYSENMNIPPNAQYNEIIKTILLAKLKTGSKVVLNNIFYDYDKSTLRPESQSELDRVYELLKDNPTLKVELSSHTDSRGSDAYNNKLSQERAQSCVDYLLKKGIEKHRIIAKGYGKQQLIITDEEIQKMKTEPEKEEAHQKNRRTEIKILEK